MELTIEKREKGNLKLLRNTNKIPAVLYGKDENISFSMNYAEFDKKTHTLERGRLFNTVFSLNLDGKQEYEAIVKDVQYNKVTHKVIHVDFQILTNDPVTLSVPIVLKDCEKCVGVKAGGVICQMTFIVKVVCSNKQIPENFVLSMKDFNIGASAKISDIENLTDGVKTSPKGVVAVVTKR